MSATTDLARAVREAIAGRRVLLVSGDTHDWLFSRLGPHRLREFLAVMAADLGMGMVAYRRGTSPIEVRPPSAQPFPGVRERLCAVPSATGAPGGAPVSPEHVLPHLIALVDDPDLPVLILIEGIENLLPDSNAPVSHPFDLDLLDMLQRVYQSPNYSRNRCLLVVSEHVAPVHHRFRDTQGLDVVALGGPSLNERIRFMELLQCDAPSPEWYAEVAGHASGLLLDDLLVMHNVAVAGGRRLDAATVASRKREVLRQRSENIELLDGRIGLDDVSAMSHLKEYVQSCRAALLPPRGLLLAGPPGTGKTYFTRALASSLGYPVVKLNLIDSSYIGENERRIRTALRAIDQLAPVVVLIDEVDVRFVARSGVARGDSGTTDRVQAEFMDWSGNMEDRTDITMIGTTNRPDRIDAALRSRFPISVPVLHPTRSDLVMLIPAVARQLGIQLDPTIDIPAVARLDALRAVSARQVGAILHEAARRAGAAGDQRRLVDGISMQAAVRATATSSAIEDEHWSLLALKDCTNRSLLSWWDGAGRRPGADIPFYAQALCGPDGALDDDLLDERLRQLQHLGLR